MMPEMAILLHDAGNDDNKNCTAMSEMMKKMSDYDGNNSCTKISELTKIVYYSTVSGMTMMSGNTLPRLRYIIYSKIHQWMLHVRYFH
jgi:hypothetical protein